MSEWIIKLFGVDKLLHFAFGYVICSFITDVSMMQEGLVGIANLWIPVIGIIVTMLFETFKEVFIDDKFDIKDWLVTLLGTAMVFAGNAIGILFYTLNN